MASRSALLPVSLLFLAASCSVVLLSSTPSTYVPMPQGLSRRGVMQAVTGASVLTFGSQTAWADAQGERIRSLKKYAPKVYALKDAAEAGDCDAILKKEADFKLLNGYWRNQDYNLKIQNDALVKIMNAASDGDKTGMKAAYMDYYNHPDLVEDRVAAAMPGPAFIRGKGDIADGPRASGNRRALRADGTVDPMGWQ